MTDREWDELLQTACLDQSRAELRAAGLLPHPRKVWRAALIAAVCAAVLTLGVAAVWPKLELRRTGALSLALGVTEGGENAPPVTGITFAGLPEGYAIVESDSDPADRWARVGISAHGGEVLTVTKYALDCRLEQEVRAGGAVPQDLDPAARLLEECVVLDSADELTPDALKEGSLVVYPTADYYYVAAYPGVDPEDVCTILAGMQ